MDEDVSTEQKTWQVYNFGKINVFRLNLNEARECFFVGEEGEGHSMFKDGPKTEKAREPAVESLVLTTMMPSSLHSEYIGQCCH